MAFNIVRRLPMVGNQDTFMRECGSGDYYYLSLASVTDASIYTYLYYTYTYLGMYRVDSSMYYYVVYMDSWSGLTLLYIELQCMMRCVCCNLWMRVCMWMCVFSKCKYVWELVFCLYIYTSNVWMRVLLNLLFIFFPLFFFGREMWILIDEMKCRYFFSVVIKRLLVTSY